jgi:hypothetical protein
MRMSAAAADWSGFQQYCLLRSPCLSTRHYLFVETILPG